MGNGNRPVERKNFSSAMENPGPSCQKCGRAHSGYCKANEVSCYRCGQSGQFKRNFPMDAAKGSKPKRNDFKKRRPAQVRVYTLTSVEADDEEEENNDVVTGTISLFGSLACTFSIQELHIHSSLEMKESCVIRR